MLASRVGIIVPAMLLSLHGAAVLAADRLEQLERTSCEPSVAESSEADLPNLLDPELRGVALGDLGVNEARAVASFLRMKGVLPVNAVMSTSIVELYANRLVVDVIGRAPRFDDSDTRRDKHGRVGLLRVSVPVASHLGVCDVGQPEVLWERSLTELDLRYRVSISDWVGVIDDQLTGFRRVYPLGGGGIDRGVRNVGVVSSMTPVIPDGRLEKRYAWRQLNSPWYFRNKPYLPISVGRTLERGDGTKYTVYFESKIAFHIWQDKGFERGFFSHGCMRLRDEDLAELAAFVLGGRAAIPMSLRLEPTIDEVRHPYPMDMQKYWQLKNFGTPAKPVTRMKYMLHEMELGTLPLPGIDELVATALDGKPFQR